MRQLITKYDNLIYTALAIMGASGIFFFAIYFDKLELIGLFSFNSVIVFLLVHCFTFGLDAYILSNINMKKLPINNFYYVPALLFGIFMLFLEPVSHLAESFQPFGIIKSDFDIGFRVQLALLAFSALFGAYGKILFSSVFFWTRDTTIANKIYLVKSFVINIVMIFFIITKNEISVIFSSVLVEIVTFIFGVYYFGKYRGVTVRRKFQPAFILSSLNVFGFDAIMKADLLLLSTLSTSKILSLYALYSAVVEGYLQLLASFRYKSSLAIKSNDVRQVNKMIKQGIALAFSCFFAMTIFIFIMGGGEQFLNYILVFLLTASVIVAVPGVILYYLFEQRGRPEKTFIVAVTCLLINLCVALFLFPYGDMYAVAAGTFSSFMFLSCTNYFFWSKAKCVD